MRALGSILVVLAGTAWGLGRSWELGARVGLLAQLEALIQWLMTEIAYSARPLPELLRTGDSPFCKAARERGEFASDPCGAFQRAGEKLLGTEGDRELFRELAGGLGASGTEGQLRHLELCQARTRQRLQEAREAKRERSRLYIGLGVLLGLGAWVLLI